MSRIIYTPEVKKRKRSSPKKIILAVGVFFLIIFILAVIIYLLRLPALQIKKIEIDGNYAIEKLGIEDKINEYLTGSYFYFIPKKNYFLARPAAIEKTLLETFLRIGGATIQKKPFNGIAVEIRERELWAIYCSQKCFFIDKSGFMYEEAFTNSGNLIRIVKTDNEKLGIGGYALTEETINIFTRLEEKINLSGLGPVMEYNLSLKSPGEIKIKTGEGFYLELSLDDDFNRVFMILETVLNEEIKEKRGNLDYIDLRFGQKVFYKYKK